MLLTYATLAIQNMARFRFKAHRNTKDKRTTKKKESQAKKEQKQRTTKLKTQDALEMLDARL
jgi:hypothetical protein